MNMKKWKWATWALSFLVISLLVLAFTPVPQAAPDNCYDVTGVVEKVYVPCCGDVAIAIKGDDHLHYINRGLDQGIDVTQWEQLLPGKVVTLKVIRRHWTPLDPTFHQRSIAAVSLDNQTIYNHIQSK